MSNIINDKPHPWQILSMTNLTHGKSYQWQTSPMANIINAKSHSWQISFMATLIHGRSHQWQAHSRQISSLATFIHGRFQMQPTFSPPACLGVAWLKYMGVAPVNRLVLTLRHWGTWSNFEVMSRMAMGALPVCACVCSTWTKSWMKYSRENMNERSGESMNECVLLAKGLVSWRFFIYHFRVSKRRCCCSLCKVRQGKQVGKLSSHRIMRYLASVGPMILGVVWKSNYGLGGKESGVCS